MSRSTFSAAQGDEREARRVQDEVGRMGHLQTGPRFAARSLVGGRGGAQETSLMDDELLAELRADGTVDSAGAFTIDLQAARHKMAAWRLAHEDLWMVGPVMLAVTAGASFVSVLDAHVNGRVETRFVFDGAPLPAAWLHSIARGLDPGPDEYARALVSTFELAVAVGAQGFRVETWSAEAPPSESPLRRTLLGTRRVTRISIVPPPSHDPCVRHTVALARCSFAPLNVLKGLENFARRRRVHAALAARVVRSGSECASRRLRIDFSPTPVREVMGHLDAALWVERGSALRADLTLVVNGVSFPGAATKLIMPRVKCVVAAPHLMPDLSMAAIIHNDDYASLVEGLHEHEAELALQLADTVPRVVDDALVLLDCAEAAAKSPLLTMEARGRILAGFVRLLGRCVDWTSVDEIVLRLAGLLRHGSSDESDRRLLAAAEVDRAAVLQSLARLLAIQQRHGEALWLQTEALKSDPASVSGRHQLALLERADGHTAEGEALHRAIFDEAADEGVRMLASTQLAWCALARGAWQEAVELCGDDDASADVSLRVQRLEALGEACAHGRLLDEAEEAMKKAATLAAEYARDDAVELAVSWRRLRIFRGDPCGLGDGVGDAWRAFISSLLRIEEIHPRSRLLAQARKANAVEGLCSGERLFALGNPQAALGIYERILMELGEVAQRQPHMHAAVLRRLATVLRTLDMLDAADATIARWTLLRDLELSLDGPSAMPSSSSASA